MTADAHTDRAALPGQRMINGKPYTYDLGLLNSHRADMLIAAAPADLSTLSYDDLTGLKYALADRNERQAKVLGGWPEPDAFAKRLWAEIPTRPEYQRAFGGKREAA